MRFTTRLLHGSFGPDQATGATTQPMFQTSAFYQETAEDMARVFSGRKPGFVYTRVSNRSLPGLATLLSGLCLHARQQSDAHEPGAPHQ